MGITHEDFLRSARQLVSGSDEVDFRNAASRAYYSAYHACDAVQDHCPNFANGYTEHERLISRFQKYPGTGEIPDLARKIARLMDQIRPSRVKADYKLDRTFSKKEAESAIYTAKRLLETAGRFAGLHRSK